MKPPSLEPPEPGNYQTTRVDQKAYRQAMMRQRTVRPDFFPENNRAARRLEKSSRRPEIMMLVKPKK